MKKIMIAAAIVCAAAFAQAAAFNWQASGVKDILGTTSYSGAATLYATTIAGASIGSWDTTMTAGAISQVISSDDFTGNVNYKFYYTMTDSKGNTFTSSTKLVKAQATQTPMINFAAGGTWEEAPGPGPEPTPEPTSAMLMLLGVAGLALKRKQK